MTGSGAATVPFALSNLREQIKDVILQRIVSHEYAPGSRKRFLRTMPMPPRHWPGAAGSSRSS